MREVVLHIGIRYSAVLLLSTLIVMWPYQAEADTPQPPITDAPSY